MWVGIVVMTILALSVAYIIYTDRKKPKDFMSFKEALELADLPVVTFYQDSQKLNFLLDTGSTNNTLDKTTAEKLTTEVNDTISRTFGLEGKAIDNIENVDLVFTYKGKSFTDKFQLIDLRDLLKAIKKSTGVTIHGIIGNSFMQKYKYVLDFKEMIAYSRK